MKGRNILLPKMRRLCPNNFDAIDLLVGFSWFKFPIVDNRWHEIC